MTQVADSKASKKKGAVVMDPERCKGCGLCVAECKLGVLGMSARLNSKGYSPAEVVQPDKCTGCGLCALMCPDMAIKTYRRKREKKQSGRAGQ